MQSKFTVDMNELKKARMEHLESIRIKNQAIIKDVNSILCLKLPKIRAYFQEIYINTGIISNPRKISLGMNLSYNIIDMLNKSYCLEFKKDHSCEHDKCCDQKGLSAGSRYNYNNVSVIISPSYFGMYDNQAKL